MFGNIGWAEFAVLAVAGLFILGPERLPSAAAWLARTLKQVREYATGARDQLKDELGPEFDDLRKPLADLQELRNLNPRTAITKHLFDGDESFLFGPSSPAGQVTEAVQDARGAVDMTKPGADLTKTRVNPETRPAPLARDERPPYDADAT
ncbi:Sec-independent protein translocase protein TatB [Rhodococcus sp. X156]|uniref:Sec-independent protein translocase protein TatB n=1 Tax=Rhodococcus sp. X156 TaxID=2499145 RepID=UPI000FD77336|nr:Sec-independent protein translocase protein TatB [Rhodococcus sp. X156]